MSAARARKKPRPDQGTSRIALLKHVLHLITDTRFESSPCGAKIEIHPTRLPSLGAIIALPVVPWPSRGTHHPPGFNILETCRSICIRPTNYFQAVVAALRTTARTYLLPLAWPHRQRSRVELVRACVWACVHIGFVFSNASLSPPGALTFVRARGMFCQCAGERRRCGPVCFAVAGEEACDLIFKGTECGRRGCLAFSAFHLRS